jgi:hypothetical protein
MLTADRLREVLSYDPETGRFTWRVSLAARGPVGAVAGCTTTGGRIVIRIDGRLHLAHRLAWLFTHGCWPAAQIDHINLDQGDNRMANLRPATVAENARNKRKRAHGKNEHKGVYWRPKERKFVAQITKDRRLTMLGRFDREEDACAAYAKASADLHGEFGRIV